MNRKGASYRTLNLELLISYCIVVRTVIARICPSVSAGSQKIVLERFICIKQLQKREHELSECSGKCAVNLEEKVWKICNKRVEMARCFHSRGQRHFPSFGKVMTSLNVIDKRSPHCKCKNLIITYLMRIVS